MAKSSFIQERPICKALYQRIYLYKDFPSVFPAPSHGQRQLSAPAHRKPDGCAAPYLSYERFVPTVSPGHTPRTAPFRGYRLKQAGEGLFADAVYRAGRFSALRVAAANKAAVTLDFSVFHGYSVDFIAYLETAVGTIDQTCEDTLDAI